MSFSKESCNDSSSFCGIRDKLYPDKRPMGYPFDRNDSAITSLRQFVAQGTNMATQQIQIRFSNVLINKS